MRGFRAFSAGVAAIVMMQLAVAQEEASQPATEENIQEIEDPAFYTPPNVEEQPIEVIDPEAAVDTLAAAIEDSTETDYFTRDTYKLTPMVCPFKGDVDYEPEHVSCGLLEVPENREKSRGRKLNLHYVKLHARKPGDWDAEERGEWAKRDDPIIYLTGGPGAKAVGYVKTLCRPWRARCARSLYSGTTGHRVF